MSEPKVTIYEAVNLARREIFIGATTLAMHELIAAGKSARPDQIRHWEASDSVDYRSIEFLMDAADAAAFMKNYRVTRSGWRLIVTDRDSG